MTWTDIAVMALQNLWSRKMRTVLNVFGVVLACVVLAMMLAGTRGVTAGFEAIINESEDARKFMVYRAWKRRDNVPDDVIKIDSEMSAARRERIQERLKEQWLGKNSTRIALTREAIGEISKVENLRSITPKVTLRGELNYGELSEKISIAMAPQDGAAASRILAGENLANNDVNGVLLSEYMAYRLGYVSDDELQELVGQTVEISIRMSGKQVAGFLGAFAGAASMSSQLESMIAVKKLVEHIDETSLTVSQKELVRKMFRAFKSSPGKELFLTETFTVRGIAYERELDGIFALLNVVSQDRNTDVYITPNRAATIAMGQEGFETYYSAVGEAESISTLKGVTDAVKSKGYTVISVARVMTRIDEEVDRVKLAVSALCFLILLISAIGISNTMVVSVLERTSEFGILKAVGAQDRNILHLMLCEGAITGFVGAIVAIFTSLGLSRLVAIAVRRYVAERIRGDFDASIFQFSAQDMILVVIVAVVVCTIAAIFPAYRAARLDPVVAMRRN